MKRYLRGLIALFFACAMLLVSCEMNGWEGFDEEDLSLYLTLGPYKGLTYTAFNTAATDEEVENAIRLRLEAATELTATEEPIAEGTTVTFDRFCFLEGVSTPSLSEEGGTYRCGTVYEDAVVTSLLVQMKGMKQGDTAELTVTLPAGYLGEGSPAKQAVYRVTVRALYVKILPELTDALAATLMAGVDTVDELRAAVRDAIEAEKRTEAAYRVEAELWDRLVAESVMIERPFDLYESYYHELYVGYENLATAATQELAEYLDASLGMTVEELETLLAEQADNKVKEALVLHAVAKTEGITCDTAEIKAFAEARAKEGSIFESGADYLAFYGEETVAEQLLKDKVIALMVTWGTAKV